MGIRGMLSQNTAAPGCGTAPALEVGDTFDGLPVSRQTRKLLSTPEGQAAWRKPYVPNSDAERRLVRKIDLRLMPILWLMYVLNYIDRTNIGNAKVGGMQQDLNLNSTGYSLGLLIFFVGYLLFEIPSNMILSRTRPSLFLPAIMLIWGCLTVAFRGVHNLGSLVGLRFALGIVESGFFPGVLFVLSSWYKPSETAKRFAIFYSASILSGAFGGLLAGGLINGLQGLAGVAGWHWLFIIEGVCTIFVALCAFFILPDYPSDTKFLTIEERALATKRILSDAARTGHVDRDITHKKAFFMAVADWKTWALTVAYMGIAGAGTISYFIPTIVSQIGYKGTDAQLYSSIPYAVAFVFSVTFNFSSDYFRDKAFHATAFISLAGLMCIVQASIIPPKASFAVLCFVAAGIWTALPVFLSFATLIIRSPPEKRAVAIAIINSLGNFSSVYGSFLWPDRTKPHYVMGWSVSAAFCFMSAVIIILMRWREGPMQIANDADAANVVKEQLQEQGQQDCSITSELDRQKFDSLSKAPHDGIRTTTHDA
ncbi:MFS general substrate transporter [Tilletiaria anomala UBC 951]|uniref:MFS general substrate transporter n=1 Tax=Tilletiaria anomala (strain ATCC 24038 / CBS 436.72 / UBC 951) TaxID=1037660 RepID=A0A066W6I7_TILAU|nr:MFS general substrate transporter [Tilletiaria anomala UBC 951]KDN49592.1 MFS general substrate transporter [Tilletiaria anomala UBC 951]